MQSREKDGVEVSKGPFACIARAFHGLHSRETLETRQGIVLHHQVPRLFSTDPQIRTSAGILVFIRVDIANPPGYD